MIELDRKSLLVLAIVLVLGGGSFAYLAYYSQQDTPKAPPTYGYTKIVDAKIYRNYTLSGVPIAEYTSIYMSINVPKEEEVRTVVVKLYSNSTPVADGTIVTTISGSKAIIMRTYSGTNTQFQNTTTLPFYGKFYTDVGVTLIKTINTKTYYGTFSGDPITYTFIYGGHNTWYGEYTGTTTISGATVTVSYRATIVQ